MTRVSFNVLNRKVHYWASFVAALPLLIMIAAACCSVEEALGLGAAVEHRTIDTVDRLEGILTSLKTVADMDVRLDERVANGAIC